MSTLYPADVRFSLEAFSRHGGLEGPHKDGWGIAYYADEDVRLVKEPLAAFESACVRYIQDRPFTSHAVVGHIRRATQGALAMKNCQPFMRELGGRMHVLAHNGDLAMPELRRQFPLGNARPVGGTDSEYAFCALLAQLEPVWRSNHQPALADRLAVVSAFAAKIRLLGPANFLYSDGDAMFIHGHRRNHGDGAGATPPGLHVLSRSCMISPGAIEADGFSVTMGPEQHAILAASVPLTSEPGWRALREGELVVAQHGRLLPHRDAGRQLPSAAVSRVER